MSAGLGKLAMLDAFMAADKRIVGADQPIAYQPGYSRHEQVAKYPLEVAGEQHGAIFTVTGNPSKPQPFFRLQILFPACLCRLDFTDEFHANALREPLDGIEYSMHGPHYHSWPINRRFYKTIDRPVELHNAIPLPECGRSFDAVLRWFCADNKIESLPANHRIELPVRRTLFE
jgi:hypothetical protein